MPTEKLQAERRSINVKIKNVVNGLESMDLVNLCLPVPKTPGYVIWNALPS
jgi:hypothetical protein